MKKIIYKLCFSAIFLFFMQALHAAEDSTKWVAIPDMGLRVMQYEVTFDQWDTCARNNGCNGYLPDDEGWGRGNQPVINVSFDDAAAYIDWYNQTFHKNARLPTETEWEFIARGNTSTHFWWGESPGSGRANCSDCYTRWSGNRTAPTGSFPPNPFGVYDITGNVWEWTGNCWEKDDCDFRPTRGGSWFSHSETLSPDFRGVDDSSEKRGGAHQSRRLPDIGFRLVESITAADQPK
jgi:formylglycine-generating enzyme required for sulfatase activity